jgi:hypothetical protein
MAKKKVGKIAVGKYYVNEDELYDRILARVPYRQFKAIMDKLELKIAGLVIDQLPKGHYAAIIQKIKRDLEKENT